MGGGHHIEPVVVRKPVVVEEVKVVVKTSADTVKETKLSILRSRMTGTNFLNSLKNLPKPLQYTIGGATGFFLAHKLLAGPQSLTLEKNFTVNKNSGVVSLATHHVAHTGFLPLAFNSFVLTFFGGYHWRAYGCTSLMKIAGLGALFGSILTAKEISTNADYTAAGANGISAALLAFHAFKTPQLFKVMRFTRLPLVWVALSLAYAMKYNDQDVLGGVTAGYLMFLLGLW